MEITGSCVLLWMTRKIKYYVPGAISLLGLPILLWIYTPHRKPQPRVLKIYQVKRYTFFDNAFYLPANRPTDTARMKVIPMIDL